MIKVFSLFLVMGGMCLALPLAELRKLNYEDNLIFENVSAMCGGNSSGAYSEMSRVWFESFKNSSLLDSAINKRNPLEVSKQFQSMVSSLGFDMALTLCFGENETQKLFFFTSLLALDISGKMTIWALEISYFKAIYTAIRTAPEIASSRLAIPKEWFIILWDLQMRKPIFWKLSAGKMGIGIFLSDIAISIYRPYINQKENIKRSQIAKTKKIDLLNTNIEQFKKKMTQVTNKDDIEMLKYFISQDEKEIDRLKKVDFSDGFFDSTSN